MQVDITKPVPFSILACVCIIFGIALGYFCSYEFFLASHFPCAQGMCFTTPIPTWLGIVFILIIAFIAVGWMLAIICVPKWVINYMERRELPGWVVYLKELIDDGAG